jgi:hypothetical protein
MSLIGSVTGSVYLPSCTTLIHEEFDLMSFTSKELSIGTSSYIKLRRGKEKCLFDMIRFFYLNIVDDDWKWLSTVREYDHMKKRTEPINHICKKKKSQQN